LNVRIATALVDCLADARKYEVFVILPEQRTHREQAPNRFEDRAIGVLVSFATKRKLFEQRIASIPAFTASGNFSPAAISAFTMST